VQIPAKVVVCGYLNDLNRNRQAGAISRAVRADIISNRGAGNRDRTLKWLHPHVSHVSPHVQVNAIDAEPAWSGRYLALEKLQRRTKLQYGWMFRNGTRNEISACESTN